MIVLACDPLSRNPSFPNKTFISCGVKVPDPPTVGSYLSKRSRIVPTTDVSPIIPRNLFTTPPA